MTPEGGKQMEPRRLTRKQEATIRRLERTLAACHRDGIALCGMNDSLYAYRADDFEELEGSLPSAFEIQQALQDESITLDDHGAYRESGGW